MCRNVYFYIVTRGNATGRTATVGRESIEERLGLGSLSDEELLVASGEIEALLAERREERERRERERREQEEANRQALEKAAKARVDAWVEYEWTRCGNKGHLPCRSGDSYPHGPYWYCYFTREDGKYTSRYVGKHLDADAARVLEAHLGKREAKKALLRGDYRVEVEAETLVGLTPEEVYPEQFEEPHREKVLAKVAKGRMGSAEARA